MPSFFDLLYCFCLFVHFFFSFFLGGPFCLIFHTLHALGTFVYHWTDFSDIFLANIFLSLTIFSVLSILHTKLRYLKNKPICSYLFLSLLSLLVSLLSKENKINNY